MCVHCGAPMDLPRSDDQVDDLATTLPESDIEDGALRCRACGQVHAGDCSAAVTPQSVEERQADAAADAAPVHVLPPTPGEGDNSRSKYEIIQEKFERLQAIKAQQKTLREEAAEIIDDLDKQQGVNRGALAEIRKMHGLDAATIQRREASRKELFDLLIKPKLEEATAGEEEE